jgi:hypothetical protein
MIRLASGLAAFSLLLALPKAAAQELMKLGEVLLFSYPDLPSNIDPKAAEPTLRALAAERSEPGVGLHLFLGDRGSPKGQYAVVWVVETLKRRQQGSSAQEPFVKNGAEYHLVAPETVGALPEVDVLGIHYTKVRPDRLEAFERFVREKLHPSVANLRPDLRILYYRSARREDAGSYLAIFALTRASRDKYWPGGSDSDALRAAFTPVQGLTKELSTFLVEGSYLADPKFAAAVFESRQWADLVLVPADPR